VRKNIQITISKAKSIVRAYTARLVSNLLTYATERQDRSPAERITEELQNDVDDNTANANRDTKKRSHPVLAVGISSKDCGRRQPPLRVSDSSGKCAERLTTIVVGIYRIRELPVGQPVWAPCRGVPYLTRA